MMHLFIDTNVVLDLVAQREPHYTSTAQLFELAHDKKIVLVLSNLSIVNAHYVLKKFAREDKVRGTLRNICMVCKVAPVISNTISQALVSAFKDFEDAIQYHSAIDEKCDAIITGNERDFKTSRLPVMNAQQFITNYTEGE